MHIFQFFYYAISSCGSVAKCLGSRTCNHEVMGSKLAAVLLSATLDKLFTHTCASVTKQYNLVPADEQ